MMLQDRAQAAFAHALLGEVAQAGSVKDADLAAVDGDETIGAETGHRPLDDVGHATNARGEFGEREPPLTAEYVAVGALKDKAREAGHHRAERKVGNEFDQVHKAIGHVLDDAFGEAGALAQQLGDGLAREEPDHGGFEGDGRGRVRPAGEDRNGVEHLAGADELEDLFASLNRALDDLHPAGLEHVEAGRRLAFEEQHLTGGNFPGDGFARQECKRLLVEPVEHRVCGEPVESFLPMMLFAVLFGLSMDYEVFLVSRMREEYLETGDNARSVARGLASTASVISAAAAIMIVVFLSFVANDQRVVKEFGLGLAVAVFVDATIVRLMLVPATMQLAGDWNWWLPGWLERLLPRISIEGAPGAVPVDPPAVRQ